MKKAPGAQANPSPSIRKRAQVDADPLVPHHADRVAEDDARLVDGEHVPDRARAETGIGERAHPAQRHGLGVREPGGVDDRADQRGDPVGLELGDGRCGEGFGCPDVTAAILRCGAANYSVILQV